MAQKKPVTISPFGMFVREMRLYSNTRKSRAYMAKRLGVKEDYLYKMEVGKIRVTDLLLRKFAEAYPMSEYRQMKLKHAAEATNERINNNNG